MNKHRYQSDIYRHKVTLVTLKDGKVKAIKSFKSIHLASEETGDDKDFILNCCIHWNNEQNTEFSKIIKWKFTHNSLVC